jgi:hypothetical protein
MVDRQLTIITILVIILFTTIWITVKHNQQPVGLASKHY